MSEAIKNLQSLIDAMAAIGMGKNPEERWWAHEAIEEIQSLQERNKVLTGALKMIAQYDSADGTEESILMDILSLTHKALDNGGE